MENIAVASYKRGIEVTKLLSKANILIRKKRPLDNSSKRINFFKRNNFLQLTFQTNGCRYSSSGSCTMCNYGKGSIPAFQTILQELEEICHSNAFLESDIVLLGASGSFLDDGEIPEEFQYDIMRRISQSHMKEVYIETHYKTISDYKLQKIKELFSDKCVHIEMGLETITEEFQINILNKIIPLAELEKIIQQIHKYNLYVDLNILFGMPFLTINQQIEDTRKSIYWALEKGADNVIVFPINIHPYTVFEWWYANGYITAPPLWGLLELLNSLVDKELAHICLAWYGNRSISYSSEQKTIIPYACPICQEQLISFFEDFASHYDLAYRIKRLQEFNAQLFTCNCRQKLMKEINQITYFDIRPRWEAAHKALERWLK